MDLLRKLKGFAGDCASHCGKVQPGHTSCASAGDLLSGQLSISGRVLAAQFSVLMTFPCTALIFKVLPTTAAAGIDSLMAPYAATLFFSGCLISW